MRLNYLNICTISLLLVFALSCNEDDQGNSDNKSETVFLNQNINSSGSDKKNNKIKYIKGPGILFFSMNEEQYHEFIMQMGADTKWEFDVIYNSFKRTAENTKKSLESNNIKCLYTTENKTGFIGEKNDTFYFDRSDQEYFVGQVLFDGKDSLYITEGLYKSDKLKDIIINFFKIENDFNIQYIPEVSDSFRYYMPDTNVINNPDSLQ